MKRLLIPVMALALLAGPALYAPSSRADSRGTQYTTQDQEQRAGTKSETRSKQQQNNLHKHNPVEENRQPMKKENLRKAPERWNTRARQNERVEKHPPMHKETFRNSPEKRNERFDWNHYRPGVRPFDWARHRHDFDRHLWERNLRATRRYHWHYYHRPHGWYYRRWVFGEIFPRAFWEKRYWITSYWRFGLPDPPYGFVWVRYGNDAVLVDVETGVILRVVYGVFY